MLGGHNDRFREDIENLLKLINTKLSDLAEDTEVAVKITDVKFPQDTDEESPVSNAAIAVKVEVIDEVHSAYGELSEWIPLNLDVGRAMAEYGSLLKNKRAKMKLPNFPSVIGSYVHRIVSPMYAVEEFIGEAKTVANYIANVAKTRNAGL
jgi:hypothetical protein